METAEEISLYACIAELRAELAEAVTKLDYVVGFISQLEAAVKSNPMASKLFGV